jgi:4-amino-4-deoxy-L-arabinose transferase-like glycosyltransferase
MGSQRAARSAIDPARRAGFTSAQRKTDAVMSTAVTQRERLLSGRTSRDLLLPASPTRGYWIALVGAAFAVRTIVALGILHSLPIVSDASAYSAQAADIVHGKASYPYYWPPGTSYVLALSYWTFGVHAWVARGLMIVVSTLSVLTTALLARRLLKVWPAAALAGWVLALYPGIAMLAAEPFAQDLTLLTLTLTALLAMRAWDRGRMLDYVFLGLSLGMAVLSRPSTLSVAPVLVAAAAIAIRRRNGEGAAVRTSRVLAGAMTSILFLVVSLAPAVIHNAAHHEGLTLATNSEADLWLGNNPYTPNYKTWDLGQRSASSFGPAAQRYLERFEHPGGKSSAPRGAYLHLVTPAERSAYVHEAVRYIEHHPAVTMLRIVNRVRAFWGFDYTMSSIFGGEWGKSAKVEAVGLVFEVGGYAILMLLVIVGLVFARPWFRPGCLALTLGLIGAFELPYVLVYAAGRWHYPVLGLLAVIAGAGAFWLMTTPGRWSRCRTSRPLWIALVLFLAVQIEYAYFATRGPIGGAPVSGVTAPGSPIPVHLAAGSVGPVKLVR